MLYYTQCSIALLLLYCCILRIVVLRITFVVHNTSFVVFTVVLLQCTVMGV